MTKSQRRSFCKVKLRKIQTGPQPGRFLKQSPIDKLYYEIPDDRATNKLLQRLRDYKPHHAALLAQVDARAPANAGNTANENGVNASDGIEVRQQVSLSRVTFSGNRAPGAFLPRSQADNVAAVAVPDRKPPAVITTATTEPSDNMDIDPIELSEIPPQRRGSLAHEGLKPFAEDLMEMLDIE